MLTPFSSVKNYKENWPFNMHSHSTRPWLPWINQTHIYIYIYIYIYLLSYKLWTLCKKIRFFKKKTCACVCISKAFCFCFVFFFPLSLSRLFFCFHTQMKYYFATLMHKSHDISTYMPGYKIYKTCFLIGLGHHPIAQINKAGNLRLNNQDPHWYHG